jgi:general secretion pathway protein I
VTEPVTARRRAEGFAPKGFTLVEVLVALAIVAIAFGVALGVMSGGLSRLDHDHNVQQALLVAQSALARVGQDIPVADGETGSEGRDGFAWHIAISPYGAAAGGLAAHRVVVTVDWHEGWQSREVRLQTVRLALVPGGGA